MEASRRLFDTAKVKYRYVTLWLNLVEAKHGFSLFRRVKLRLHSLVLFLASGQILWGRQLWIQITIGTEFFVMAAVHQQILTPCVKWNLQKFGKNGAAVNATSSFDSFIYRSQLPGCIVNSCGQACCNRFGILHSATVVCCTEIENESCWYYWYWYYLWISDR